MKNLVPISLSLAALCLSAASTTAQSPTSSQGNTGPLPPKVAPSKMTLPEGFQVSLFAGEPDVVQPIAMTLDERGRLWVVECLSYPNWQSTGKDRVVIFEDTDGDGQFDQRKVFWDQGANLTGIELGFGGVYLCATPKFIFVPDRDRNDRPDGPPEVLLDGWDLKGKHNVFNGLTWGPDGWLYGCNGILSNSKIGKPGTPEKKRIPFNCGIWRYHPTQHKFEPVAWGTTNPWGLDYDDYGQMFLTNCVIRHLFHVVPGAHFKRMFGQDVKPHTFELIESCADYLHWGGGAWQSSRGGQGKHDTAGGGHAHAGAMIYLGDNWPDEYRNSLFTCNIHGNRVNRDLLIAHESGYKSVRGEDFLFANDTWFRGLELKYGPDGGVYLTDWNDTGECHDYVNTQRATGRIYKVTYGQPKQVTCNLHSCANSELVQYQLHKNDWYVRQARRILQERSVVDQVQTETYSALRKMLLSNPDVTRKLRALWALHACNQLTQEECFQLLNSEHDWVRVWAVTFSLEDRKLNDHLKTKLIQMAQSDSSARVRLAIASGLQRIPVSKRFPLAQALASHAEDADDHNLPLMIWYAVEPLVEANPTQAAKLIRTAKIPLVRQHIARRIAIMAQ